MLSLLFFSFFFSQTELHVAAYDAKVERVKELLAADVANKSEILDARDKNGWTALMCAAQSHR